MITMERMMNVTYDGDNGYVEVQQRQKVPTKMLQE